MRTTQSIRQTLVGVALAAATLLGPAAEAGRFIPSSCLECTGPVTWVVFVAQDAGDTEAIAFTLRERYGGHVSAVWPDGKFAIEATTDEVRGMLADARVTLIDGRAGRYYRARGTRAAAETTSSPEAGSNVWSTGRYEYDGAGNILQIGPNQPWNQTDVYRYDRVGRLLNAQVSAANAAAQPSGAVQWSEAYAYDAFGNMLSKTTTRGIGATPETTTISVDASTNRLSGIYDPNGTSYDAGGNWRGASGITQTFDAMNRMTSRSVTGAGEEHYIYASGGERVATYWTPSQVTRYTLRGPDQKVLREFEKSATGALTWKKDHIWRGGSLLASITDDARTTHYHLDHLGTPRLLTDGSGDLVAMNAYLPFGGEIPDGEPDGERHKFTGHERDNLGNGANALDYMHARYYNPNLGRFLSVDPVLGSASTPQSWNRYGYALNNPLGLVDRTGKCNGLPDDVERCTDMTITVETTPASGADYAVEAVGEALDKTVYNLLQMAGTENIVDGMLQDDPGKLAKGYGQQLLLASGGVSSGLKPLAASGDVVFGGTTTLFRSVSQAEFGQVMADGVFRAGQGSMEGKWFAESVGHAAQWGEVLGNPRIVSATLPTRDVIGMLRLSRLDGIGAARWAELDQLTRAIIKAIR